MGSNRLPREALEPSKPYGVRADYKMHAREPCLCQNLGKLVLIRNCKSLSDGHISVNQAASFCALARSLRIFPQLLLLLWLLLLLANPLVSLPKH